MFKKGRRVLIFIFIIFTGLLYGCTNPGTGSMPPNTVSIGDNFFSTTPLNVTVNSTVTWTNNGSFNHTVTSSSGMELNSGTISPGGNYLHQFLSAGTFDYYCTFHGTPVSGMSGQIVVTN